MVIKLAVRVCIWNHTHICTASWNLFKLKYCVLHNFGQSSYLQYCLEWNISQHPWNQYDVLICTWNIQGTITLMANNIRIKRVCLSNACCQMSLLCSDQILHMSLVWYPICRNINDKMIVAWATPRFCGSLWFHVVLGLLRSARLSVRPQPVHLTWILAKPNSYYCPAFIFPSNTECRSVTPHGLVWHRTGSSLFISWQHRTNT